MSNNIQNIEDRIIAAHGHYRWLEQQAKWLQSHFGQNNKYTEQCVTDMVTQMKHINKLEFIKDFILGE